MHLLDFLGDLGSSYFGSYFLEQGTSHFGSYFLIQGTSHFGTSISHLGMLQMLSSFGISNLLVSK